MREQAYILVGALIVTVVIILGWHLGQDVFGGIVMVAQKLFG